MASSSSFLSSAGLLLKSLNPSLPPAPPPPEEVTGHDVCFVGGNDANGRGHDVLCRDLPFGMRGTTGSWYLTPERHIIEYIIVNAVFVAIIKITSRSIPTYRAPGGKRTAGSTSDADDDLRPPAPVRILSALFFTAQCTYKCSGYPGKWLSMLLPCNVLWSMHVAVAYLPLSPNACHVIIQLSVAYSGLAAAALANPDTDDCVLPFEKAFFLAHHTALLAMTAYHVGWSGKITLMSPQDCTKGAGAGMDGGRTSSSSSSSFWGNFMAWHMLACSLFGLFYFTVVTPISIYSGFNLNYMLSPPPNPGDFVSGPNFRIMSIGCCSALFFVMRLLAVAGEKLGRWMQSLVFGSFKRKDS